MHEFDTKPTFQLSDVEWRSIAIAAVWLVLASIPLMILVVLQRQADQELSEFRTLSSLEQQKLAELKDKVQLNRELGLEIERLKPKVQKQLAAYSFAQKMPDIDAALPIIHRQNEHCLWIWVPAGNHLLELYSDIFSQEQDSNTTPFIGNFSTLKKTASFQMSNSGWYRFSFERPWGSEPVSELTFEFKDVQSDETRVVPLGIKKVASTGSYSSDVDLIYWPNMIPTGIVRNTAQPVTNSQLAKGKTPLLQKLRFSSTEQSLFCCIKLSINLQQDDSVSAERPYAGDYQQLERAIIDSHQTMR